MSWQLHLRALALASITTALACNRDPVSAIAPPPSFYEASASGCMSMLQSTEVEPDPTSSSVLRYPTVGSPTGGLWEVAIAPWGDDQKRFVVADRARGVRVVDATDAQSPRIGASTALPERPLELRVIGDRALLIVATPHGHELWWLALSTSEAPAVIARQTQVGELRGAHALPGLRARDKPARVALVVDFQPAGPCGREQQTFIRIVELTPDRMAVTRALDLGGNGQVQRVLRSGDWLAVHDHQHSERGELTSSVRFFDLSEEAIPQSDPFIVKRNVHAFHADGRTLDIVSWDAELTDPPHQASLRGHYAVDQLRVPRTGTAQPAHACTFDLQAQPPAQSWQMADLPRISGAVFLPDRTLVAFHTEGAVSSEVRVIDHRTCATQITSLPGTRLMLTPTGDALVSIAPEEGSALDVYVHDPARLGTPTATAHVALARPALRADSVHRSEHAFWVSSARWHTLGKQQLLSIPFQEYGTDGAFMQGGQTFEIEPVAVRARDRRDWPWLLSPNGDTTYIHESGLRLGERGALDLWTRHLDAQLLNDRRRPDVPRGIARIRYPGARPAYDPQTDALKAQLEVVAGDRDPQTGAAGASFEISAHAALYTVGSLLIATSQELVRWDNRPASPCHFEIFDVTKVATAKKVASLVESELCDAAHSLNDQPAFSTPHALVFTRAEHHYKTPHEVNASRLAFTTLDLRDPARPLLRAPFRTPEGEYVLRAFGDGVSVVYGFYVGAQAKNAARPVGRFYIRFVDFSDPAAPKLGEPIAMRGELIGWNGDMLYVREAQWRGETPKYDVHRFVLQGNGVVQYAESGIDEQSVYNYDRVTGVEADDQVVDTSGDEIVLIKQGAIRRIPRAAMAPQ